MTPYYTLLQKKTTKIYRNYYHYNTCNCVQQQAHVVKTGWNDPTQTESARISSLANTNLGGKLTFGNSGIPVKIDYLGSVEGQPGGSIRPLRNRF